MADNKTTKTGSTQAQRRLRFGLNVTVAVAAAIVLVVLVNWISYRQYIRIDLTATRQYSLSPQTEMVLKSLDQDYRIVALLREDSAYLQRASDLVDEYGRYGKHVSVEHINPGLDIAQRDRFQRQLLERFTDELEPVRTAVEAGRETMAKVGEQVAAVLPALKEVAESPELADGQIKQFTQSVMAAFKRIESELAAADETLETAVNDPLPDYDKARSDAMAVLQQLDQGVLTVAIERFKKFADQSTTPRTIANGLLGVVKQLEVSQQTALSTLSKLQSVLPTERYNKVRSDLARSQAVVVLGPEQVRVIAATDLFREPDPQTVQQTGEPELRSQVEEKLTGALVSMSLDQSPMVVFVSSSQRPAIGPGGEYEQVAQRLRNINFDVQAWNPAGRHSPMGGMTPPGPAPQPGPGQRAIWIILPQPPDNPMNPMANMGGGKQAIADHLTQRLAAGDAAMVIFSFNPMAGMAETDPLVQIAQTWGITPQLDRVIMSEVQLPNRQTQASAQINITHWPEVLPITKALSGMPALLLQASPLVLEQSDASAVTRYPLIEATGERMWAARNIRSAQDAQQAKFDPAQAAERFVVGAAAQQDDQRLIVVADPAWASDTITTYGALGPGSADVFGAAFPGNSELFVNSVYWLAGLDQLIAASPRTQDIRRIQAMSDTVLSVYQWAMLAGMPAVVLAAGLGVWFVRRRG